MAGELDAKLLKNLDDRIRSMDADLLKLSSTVSVLAKDSKDVISGLIREFSNKSLADLLKVDDATQKVKALNEEIKILQRNLKMGGNARLAYDNDGKKTWSVPRSAEYTDEQQRAAINRLAEARKELHNLMLSDEQIMRRTLSIIRQMSSYMTPQQKALQQQQEAYRKILNLQQEIQRIRNRQAERGARGLVVDKATVDAEVALIKRLETEIRVLKRERTALAKESGVSNSSKLSKGDYAQSLEYQRQITRETVRHGEALERIREHQRKVKSGFEQMVPILRRLVGAFGVAFSVQGLVQFGKKLVETRGEFELQQVALRSILQNKQLADEIWDKTMRAALQSPFTTMQLTKYTKQLAAYRIETDKLFDTTKRLADVSAGLGVDMQRLILAYGQVKAANYLRASEIRQFTEAGVNVLGELRDYFNDVKGMSVDTAEVMNMVQKRLVKFEDIEAIFKRMTDAGGIFYNMQYVQSQTVKGQINKLRDAYDQMLNSIGKGNEGVIKKIVSAFNNIVKNWRTLAAVIKSFGFATAVGFVSKYAMALGGVSKASVTTLRNIVKLRGGILSLKKAFAANLPALAIASGAALIATLVNLYKRMKNSNREIDEQNLRLYETRRSFEDLRLKIEENNKTIKENKSSTDTLNKAQNENRSIMKRLQDEYPQLAEKMNIATNGIINMNGAIDTNIRKLNEQMTILAALKQKNIFSDTGQMNLQEWESDLSAMHAALATAQSTARRNMMLLEQQGETDTELYNTLRAVSELDLSGNILDAADAFKTLAGSIDAYSNTWEVVASIGGSVLALAAGNVPGAVAGVRMATRKANNLRNYFGIEKSSLVYRHDENSVEQVLSQNSALLKQYYLNGIRDNAEWLAEIEEMYNTRISEMGGNLSDDLKKSTYDNVVIEWISRNARRINEGTIAGINHANDILIKSLGPQTDEMKSYLNDYYNNRWGFIDREYINELKESLNRLRVRQSMGIGTINNKEIEQLERQIADLEKGVDLFSGANGRAGGSPIETPEERQARIDAEWRRRIQLLEEMKRRYDELSKSAYGYAKSEKTVRDAFDDVRDASGNVIEKGAFSTIFAGTGITMDQIDFTSMEGMFRSMKLALQQAKGISDAVREEIMKKIDSYEAQITINAQVRIREDFGRQMEEAFGNYELTLELQKLNLPSGLAAEMWGIEEVDIQGLRAKLSEMYEGLLDENGMMSEDAFKLYENYLKKIDDLERKLQRDRLKDYAKYIEYQYSERVKLEMEYVRRIAQLNAETSLTQDQRDAIREGIDREFAEKSKQQDWEDFKSSEFYVQMMEDLEKQGTASLEVMKRKLIEMRANAENLSPRALKEIVKALEKIEEIEASRIPPLRRIRKEMNRLQGVDIAEIYKRQAANNEAIGQNEEELRQLNRMIMLQNELNRLKEQGVTEDTARHNVELARERVRMAQTALDTFTPTGDKSDTQTVSVLNETLNNEKMALALAIRVLQIITGRAAAEEQAQGNKYMGLSISELNAQKKALEEQREELDKNSQEYNELIEIENRLENAWNDLFNSIKDYAQRITGVFDGVMDTVDYFTASTYGMTAAWKEFGNSASQAFTDLVSGIQEYKTAYDAYQKAQKANNVAEGLLTGDIIKLALVVLGVIIKIVQAVAKLHDDYLDKEIEVQQEKIDALKDAYARLEKQIEKTWDSVSYMQTYEQQVQNIREQIDAMESQMAAERAKKNTDESAVLQYQRDIQDAYDQLDELEQKQREVFGGIGEEGYRSAAEGFVEAWKSAFLETGDGLQGLQDHFDEFLQDWFVKQATMQGVAKYYGKVFDYINDVVADGSVPTYQEIENARGLADEAAVKADELMRIMAGIFGVGDSGSLSGLAAGIQGMTEEQANILEAYWNSVRMYTASIDMNVARIAEMLGVGGANTNPLLQQMSIVAASTQATHQLLQSVSKSGHPQGGYGIKVFNN